MGGGGVGGGERGKRKEEEEEREVGAISGRKGGMEGKKEEHCHKVLYLRLWFYFFRGFMSRFRCPFKQVWQVQVGDG